MTSNPRVPGMLQAQAIHGGVDLPIARLQGFKLASRAGIQTLTSEPAAHCFHFLRNCCPGDDGQPWFQCSASTNQYQHGEPVHFTTNGTYRAPSSRRARIQPPAYSTTLMATTSSILLALLIGHDYRLRASGSGDSHRLRGTKSSTASVCCKSGKDAKPHLRIQPSDFKALRRSFIHRAYKMTAWR